MARESFSAKKKRASRILLIFKKIYPRVWCTLDYKNPFQLLISTILSAQCTDARVNMVTPALFAKYPDAASMSRAPISSLEFIIRSTGFYHSKAKAIKETSRLLVKNFGSKVPSDMASLLTLRGVARKTANIILFHCFGQNSGIAVDTHCMRVSYRLGLTSSRDKQNLIEKELMLLIPRSSWGMYTNWMVSHGRKYCMAKNANCAGCPLNKLCPGAFKV